VKNNLIAFLISAILTSISYFLGLLFHWVETPPFLELFSVFTSYWCTYLCVFQSRLNYPIGAVSVASLGLLFYQQSLYASMALQLWLFPAMLYGWLRWGPDKSTRKVTRLRLDWWLAAYAGFTFGIYLICYWLNFSLSGEMPALDSSILILSILAQFLMDNKKIENWGVWLIVDIISTYEYAGQGLPVLSIQMALFGLNALWGWYEWRKTNA